MRAKLAGFLTAAVLLPAAVGPVSAEDHVSPAITEVRQESTERSTRVIVGSTGPLAYTYYSPDPLTLVVDIPEVDASRVPSRIAVGTREVDSVRVTSLARGDGRSIARLEVRLASLVPYQIYSKDQALNLVFERPQEAAQAPASPAREAVRTEVVAAAQPDSLAADASRPAASDPSGPPATQILAVTPSEVDGNLSVHVRANGVLRYQEFFLGNPDRLVVDFADVLSKAPVRALDVNRGPVRKARVAQFSAASPKVARLVLDLSSRAPYHIVSSDQGVDVVFGEGAAPSPAPLAALKAEPEPTVLAAAVAAAVHAPVLPPAAMPITPEPAPLPQAGPGKESFEPRTVGSAQKQYSGHPISLDFKDGDLQDIFRLFADISGLNVVVNPGVGGKVTLKLNEVPWDQALDLILKTNKLGYTLEDNVIRIARLSDLQAEEEEKRKLAEAQSLAGTLIDFIKPISYAKADSLSTVVKQAGGLSQRGQITVDTRTNTMIIRDLPSYVEKAKNLILELDRATRQVEIEARIVVTTRNFTRDLGIQWGFNQTKSPAFANTTNLTFPHSFIVNGQGVPGGGLPADQSGAGPAAGIGDTGRGYAVNLPAAGFNSALGITLGNIAGNFNLDAALTALEQQGRGRLLSTPKVTTQNNQEAEIKQGVQIPIQTVANNTVTVSFKDAVLTLKVTPQITEAGTVILSLDLQNNAPDFGNRVNGIPPINTQSAKTNVLVQDGATTVIGGIYQSDEQTSQASTPFLGRLPILGYLFRNRFVRTSNTELLLFITPRIVKG